MECVLPHDVEWRRSSKLDDSTKINLRKITADRIARDTPSDLEIYQQGLEESFNKDVVFVILRDSEKDEIKGFAMVADPHIPNNKNLEKTLCFRGILVSLDYDLTGIGRDLVFQVLRTFRQYHFYGLSRKGSPLNKVYEEWGARATNKNRFLPRGHHHLNNPALICYTWSKVPGIDTDSSPSQSTVHSSSSPSQSTVHSSSSSPPSSPELAPGRKSRVGELATKAGMGGPIVDRTIEGVVYNYDLTTAQIQQDGTWQTSFPRFNNTNYKNVIAPLTRGVGIMMVEFSNGTSLPLGTGWVIQKAATDQDVDLIVTNKHVARQVYAKVGGSYKKSHAIQVFIDFTNIVEEGQKDLTSHKIELELLCWIGGTDIAYFKPLQDLPADIPALPIAGVKPSANAPCFTLGYPFPDSREKLITNEATLRKYFPDGLKRKTIAFSQVQEIHEKTLHVASYTLGGNSGSPVLDVTGHVIGIHYSAERVDIEDKGERTIYNKAETAETLLLTLEYALDYAMNQILFNTEK